MDTHTHTSHLPPLPVRPTKKIRTFSSPRAPKQAGARDIRKRHAPGSEHLPPFVHVGGYTIFSTRASKSSRLDGNDLPTSLVRQVGFILRADRRELLPLLIPFPPIAASMSPGSSYVGLRDLSFPFLPFVEARLSAHSFPFTWLRRSARFIAHGSLPG